MNGQLVVNGRFLGARPTGLHRTARALLDAATRRGLRAEVIAPSGTHDPRVDGVVPAPRGRLGGHVWEQVVLPISAGGRPVLSLANTAPLLARRSIVMVHDLATLVEPDWFTRSMRLYGSLTLAAARRSEVVLTVSESVRGELEGRGVDPGRLVVIPPAVDPSFEPADDAVVAAVRQRLGLHGPYLVLIGWADPRKDAATAVAAHRRAMGEVAHQLVLVGGRHPAFAPVALPDVATVVETGYLSERDLRGVLTGATALLYPSRYEGFGLPPLEAWACGTPALLSDIPVLRESTGGRAQYVPPGDVDAWADAVVTVLRDRPSAPSPPLRTWDDAAEELLGALSEL